MSGDSTITPSCSVAPRGLGWRRDRPDYRDLTPDAPQVEQLLQPLRRARRNRGELPKRVDLREYFAPVRDQPPIPASTARACAALLEYFERRALGKTVEYSALFLHQTVRKLLRSEGESGANLRAALKVLVRFGLPPESYWPRAAESSREEPDAFVYALAQPPPQGCYVRLDGRNSQGAETLDAVRAFLAAGYPVAFGFPVPSSISDEPDIPYRPTFDSILGGQAVIAAGYDDRRLRATKGALLIRNSWGAAWGEAGYGWLPYAYVAEQLAVDFWTLLSPAWLASGEFRRPR